MRRTGTFPALPLLAFMALTGLLAAGCGGGGDAGDTEGHLTGAIRIDGSSTVFPVSEAMAEEFQLVHPDTRVTVGVSGTGGGFQRFCSGETHVSNASREITDEERERCRTNGIEFEEVPVAVDGLAVLTNPQNDFLQCITMEELRRVWEPGSQVETWRDVRPEWPAEAIDLYGPGTDSGTFDYFTEEVMGEAKASRADYQASEDDNILVQGVAGDQGSLGYFGYAYYLENQGMLKLVPVDGGDGCVEPTDETIETGEYPLARPLYIYVSTAAVRDAPQVREFVRFYIENASAIVPSTGYHPLAEAEYAENLSRVVPGGPGEGVDTAGPDSIQDD